MIFLLNLLSLMAGFLRLSITPVKTNPNNTANVEQAGAMIPGGALIPALQALANNASPAFGNWSSTIVPNSPATTYLGSQLVGGIIKRFSAGAAATDSTDTATNIVNAIPGATVGQSFLTLIANLGSGAITVAAGTGVTLLGTTTIASNGIRLFLGEVLGSSSVRITGMFQWGGGAGYTGATGL